MQTDTIPSESEEKDEYWRSDAMRAIDVPSPQPLQSLSIELKEALKTEDKKRVQAICAAMLDELSSFYGVETPKIKILNKRPLKVTKEWSEELFGEYDPDTETIRLWMRTAVQKKPTSHGVLLSTFCHEFFHHVDMVSLEFPNTFHTRGFYERVGLLYHLIQNTPIRTIVWKRDSDGTYRVDWGKTMANKVQVAK